MANKSVILTEGQANVLKHMIEDDLMLLKQEARVYVAGMTGSTNLNTFRALLDKGYIVCKESDLTTATFERTRAGADALEQYEQEKGTEVCSHCTQ